VNGGGPIDIGGVYGMKPRFDPFGPPGGPTEPHPNTFPGGTGNPNNDLAIPPPVYGFGSSGKSPKSDNNMFL
jgi:hypothetical protein